MDNWQCVLELDADRRLISGSETSLADAIRRGADLRIFTEFIHNEHIDVISDSSERIQEVAEFAVTYLLDDAWTAGIMSLRQPIALPTGFGPRPSMSFFLYNQDGTQGIARPHLDGPPASGRRGRSSNEPPPDMPKYHVIDTWDATTNAPSQTFIYDFDVFRFCVCDTWREVLAHDADGRLISGSFGALVDAFASGCALKIGVAGLCAEVEEGNGRDVRHDVFVEAGSGYHYTEQGVFMVGSHPIIRIAPAVPLRYRSGNWDVGWLMVRTDGHVVYRRCDPYTLAFRDITLRCAVRWFVR